MRTVRVQFGDEVHLVTVQDRTDELGVRLLTCECGRSGWGQRGLATAHMRAAPIARAITPGPRTLAAPPVTWRDKEWWWRPMFDDRQERREHLFWTWWQGSQGRTRLVTRLGEKGLCTWYGHQESHDVPGICYFCQRRRPRWFARRWRPAPAADPALRPGEGRQPTLIQGEVLKPVVCGEHHYRTFRPHHCPYCEMRKS